MKERQGNTFWYVWAIFCTGLVIGGVCITQHGDAARLTVPTKVATRDQVGIAETEMRSLLSEMGYTEEQVEHEVLKLRCKYLPDETEGCDVFDEGR